jgi:tetratricopeptide (TPR) repeat protein
MFFLFLAETAKTQAPDTLTMARSLQGQGKLKESMEILAAYHKTHPDDLYSNWIYAQAAYEAHRFRLSASLYEKAVGLAPKDMALLLDYAKFLVNTGEFKEAGEQLKRYTDQDKSNPEPWYYLAKIHYWKGDNKEALRLLGSLLRNVPGYTPARVLMDQILFDRSPWLSLDASYAADDQPLHLFSPVLKGGWYRSNLLGLDFQVTAPVSLGDSGNFSAAGISAGNRFHFSGPDLNIYLNLGMYNHTSLHSTGWTGEVKVEKIFFKKFSVLADLERKPYIWTLSSLKIPLFENHLTLAASLNDPDHWNGRLSFEGSTFSSDDNSIIAFCGWIFAPAVKTGRFDFHFGYGYNYSTAKESRFTNEEPLSAIISGWEPDVQIAGIYNPYFTPNKQQVHSLLATINFMAARTLNFSLNFNGGFYATTQYPYLFLDQDASDSIFVNRSFEKKSYFPVNVKAGMDWHISKTFEMLAQFIYNSTIYYKTEVMTITIRKRF